MGKSKDFFEEKKEKYKEMIVKGESISHLRSIRETKKDKLERAKRDKRNKRAVYNSLGRDDENLESEIDSIENEIYEISSEISSIDEVILEEAKTGKKDKGGVREVFNQQYDPLEHMSAHELEKYGVDLEPVRRTERIEMWLDKNCSGWAKGEIPSKYKR